MHSLQPSVYLASGLMLDALSLADCGVTWPLSSTLSIAYSLGPGYSCCFNLASVWYGCGTAEGGPYREDYPALLLSKPMGASHHGSVLGRLRQEGHMSSRLASAT